ncbi:hypothetical protein ZWY2020_048107 [Hordeum vulgare]|nr:hypothetical protein ZWY2020_048107 [Hordeum vulgare]
MVPLPWPATHVDPPSYALIPTPFASPASARSGLAAPNSATPAVHDRAIACRCPQCLKTQAAAIRLRNLSRSKQKKGRFFLPMPPSLLLPKGQRHRSAARFPSSRAAPPPPLPLSACGGRGPPGGGARVPRLHHLWLRVHRHPRRLPRVQQRRPNQPRRGLKHRAEHAAGVHAPTGTPVWSANRIDTRGAFLESNNGAFRAAVHNPAPSAIASFYLAVFGPAHAGRPPTRRADGPHAAFLTQPVFAARRPTPWTANRDAGRGTAPSTQSECTRQPAHLSDAGGRSTLHHRSPPHIPLLQRLPFGEEEPDEGEVAEDVMGSLLTEYLGSPQEDIAASKELLYNGNYVVDELDHYRLQQKLQPEEAMTAATAANQQKR